jgi:hypothetical protein
MNSRRAYAIAVMALLAAAGTGACGERNEVAAGVEVVDDSVGQHALLDDVLAIEAQRRSGGFGFSYVPKNRPEGLRRLSSTTSADARVVDGYQVGAERVEVMVEFAAKRTGTCADMKADPGSGLCVREGTVGSGLRSLTVYVSQVGIKATIPDDATTRGVAEFWATTEMVPAGEAVWFTELVARARAAPKVKFG